MSELTRNEYYNLLIDSREIFTGYGRYLESNQILNDTIEDYENYLISLNKIDNIKIIEGFIERLIVKEYKVILYNGQIPILEDDLGIIELIVTDIDGNSKVDINDDLLVIHMKNETIKLKGYMDMSDGEIFARQYLNHCEGTLIIKNSLSQIELTENNFHDIIKENIYGKCNSIVNIRKVLEDSEYYKLNWDAIIIKYDNGSSEIWQPM